MAFNLISLEMQNIITEMWPRQNDRHFADDIFIYIFFNQNIRIFYQYFAELYSHESNALGKEIVEKYVVDRY